MLPLVVHQNHGAQAPRAENTRDAYGAKKRLRREIKKNAIHVVHVVHVTCAARQNTKP